MRTETTGWGTLDYHGAALRMRTESPIERRFRLNACAKEPWTAEWLDTLGPSDRLVNVGANVGSYALIAAWRGADVICVEAHPLNAARLAENAMVNGLGGSRSARPDCGAITVVLAACGPTLTPWLAGYGRDEPGTADLRLAPASDGPIGGAVTIPGTTLDDLSEVYGQPTHMLIDVDGGELDVLRGGTEALARVREVMIEVSTEARLTDGCVKALNAAGLSEVGRWDTRGGQPIQDVWYGLFRRV